MTLKEGIVTAHRYDDGNLWHVYTFPVECSMANPILDLWAIDLKFIDSKSSQAGKTRTFKFESQGDCSKFGDAFKATKEWMSK